MNTLLDCCPQCGEAWPSKMPDWELISSSKLYKGQATLGRLCASPRCGEVFVTAHVDPNDRRDVSDEAKQRHTDRILNYDAIKYLQDMIIKMIDNQENMRDIQNAILQNLLNRGLIEAAFTEEGTTIVRRAN